MALEAIGTLSEAEAKGVIEMALTPNHQNGKKPDDFKPMASEQEYQHALTLLSLAEMAARYSSRFGAMQAAAMQELDHINKKIADEEEKIAKAKAEEKAKEDAKKAADAKAARDKAKAEAAAPHPATPRVS
jgi:uncharacterized small protein (DUF1192 family)